MKKFISILVMIIIFATTACSTEQNSVTSGRFNSINFEEYRDTFNAMFDNEWILLSVEEIYNSGWTHTEWTIEYRDGNEEIRYMVLDNRFTICTHISSYLGRITEYYKKRFLDTYINEMDIPYTYSIFFSGQIVRSQGKCACVESDKWFPATGGYRARLNTPETALRLSQLTPANIFEMIPFYFTIDIVFDESLDSNQHAYEEHVVIRIEEMIEAMNYFTSNHINARIHIGTSRWNYEQAWNYIQGERVIIEPWTNESHYWNHWGSPFSLAVFESYRGLFW